MCVCVGGMGENGEKNQDQGFLVDSEIEASKRKNQQGKRSNIVEDEEFMVLSNSFAMDPIKIELNRLTNQIKGIYLLFLDLYFLHNLSTIQQVLII